MFNGRLAKRTQSSPHQPFLQIGDHKTMRAFKGNPNYAAKQKLVADAKAAAQKQADAPEETDEQDNLSPKQWDAINNLLAGQTLQAAADSCEINVRTLRRWLNTQEFVEAYHSGRHHLMETQAAELRALVSIANQTLYEHLTSDNKVVQLRALKFIHQFTQKQAQNAEIKRRLDDLANANAQQAEQIRRLEEENLALRALISEPNETSREPKEPTKPIEAWMSLPQAGDALQLSQDLHVNPQGIDIVNAPMPAIPA